MQCNITDICSSLAIIQLMAAAEVGRPLIYVAYKDKKVFNSLYEVYQYLLDQRATVRDLYQYLKTYCKQSSQQEPLFDYILKTPIKPKKS